MRILITSTIGSEGEVLEVDSLALPEGYDADAWVIRGEVLVDGPVLWDAGDAAIVEDFGSDMARLRAQRDMLMFATDPTQLPDKDPSYRETWKSWRDLLLALPETTADPANPVWPIPPDADELTKLVGAFMAARTATAPTF